MTPTHGSMHPSIHGIMTHGIMISQLRSKLKAHGTKMTNHGMPNHIRTKSHTMIMNPGIIGHHGMNHMTHGIPIHICLECASKELQKEGRTTSQLEQCVPDLVIGLSHDSDSDWTAGLETEGILSADTEIEMKYMKIL